MLGVIASKDMPSFSLRKKEDYLKEKVDRMQCRMRLNNFDIPICELLRRHYYGLSCPVAEGWNQGHF